MSRLLSGCFVSSLTLSICANGFAANGDITVTGTTSTEELKVNSMVSAGAPEFSSPVCHDITGMLGNCDQQTPYRVARVAINGGDYTSPVAAVDDLASWCGVPSSANPCLIQLYPGVYDIGTGSVHLDYDHLDLAGSGKNITTIVGQTISANSKAVVDITASSYVHDLSITNNRGLANATAVAIDGFAKKAVISRVNLNADSLANINATAVQIGIDGSPAYPTITDSYLYAHGSDSVNTVSVKSNSRLTLEDSTLSVKCSAGCRTINLNQGNLVAHHIDVQSTSDVLFMWEDTDGPTYTATITDSILSRGGGVGTSIFSGTGNDHAVSIATTQLKKNGGSLGNVGTGTLKCVYAYDDDFNALGTDCQPPPP